MKLNIMSFKIMLAKNMIGIPELASLTKISMQTLYSYSKGKRNPSTKNIGKISKALKCSVEDLVEM